MGGEGPPLTVPICIVCVCVCLGVCVCVERELSVYHVAGEDEMRSGACKGLPRDPRPCLQKGQPQACPHELIYIYQSSKSQTPP